MIGCLFCFIGSLWAQQKTTKPLSSFAVLDYASGYTKTTIYRAFKNNKWGYVNKSGEVLIPFIYEHAENFDKNGRALVQKEGVFFCIDISGKRINTCKQLPDWQYTLDTSTYFGAQIIRQKVGKRYNYGLVSSETGRVLVPIIYTAIEKREKEWFFRAKTERKQHIIDANFELAWTGEEAFEYNERNQNFIVKNNRKYGLINKNFKLIVPYQYSFLIEDSEKEFYIVSEQEPTERHYGYDAENNSKQLYSFEGKDVTVGNLALIDTSGRILTSYKYDYINLDRRSSNYFGIIKDSLYGVIDTSGKEILAPQFSDNNIGYPFYNRRIWYRDADKVGFLDTNGDTIIPAQFDNVEDFEQNYAAVCIDRKWGIIDTNGKQIIPFEYDDIDYSNGNYIVRRGELSGLLDKNFRLLTPIHYNHISTTPDSFYIVIKDDLYGVLNIKGDEIIPITQNRIEFVQPRLSDACLLKLENSFIVYDKQLNRLMPIPQRIMEGKVHPSGYLVFKEGKKFGLLSVNGSLILKPIYDELYFFNKQPLCIRFLKYEDSDAEARRIDSAQMEMSSCERGLFHFDEADVFYQYPAFFYWMIKFSSGVLISVKQAGKWSIIDTTGALVNPSLYDGIGDSYFKSDFAIVCRNGKYGTISIDNGAEVIPCIYDELKQSEVWVHDDNSYVLSMSNYEKRERERYFVKKDGKWNWIYTNGNYVPEEFVEIYDGFKYNKKVSIQTK